MLGHLPPEGRGGERRGGEGRRGEGRGGEGRGGEGRRVEGGEGSRGEKGGERRGRREERRGEKPGVGCGPSHSARVCSVQAHLLNPARGPSSLHAHYGEGGPTGAEHVTVIFRELRELGKHAPFTQFGTHQDLPTQPHITSCSRAVQRSAVHRVEVSVLHV